MCIPTSKSHFSVTIFNPIGRKCALIYKKSKTIVVYALVKHLRNYIVNIARLLLRWN